ncbi:MAG: hypothetical protein HUU57_08380 [Bdellovibrio sp.]|nr:hypothetical protein [Bdellovibrio sp.]
MKLKVLAVVLSLTATGVAKANKYDLSAPQLPENCQIISADRQGGPGLRYVVCQEKSAEANKPFLIIKSEYQALPAEMKELFKDRRGNIKDWDQVFVSISTENDDLVLFGLCKARDTSCSDDEGYTVGSTITIGATYQGRYDVQLKVANALYTKSDPSTFRYNETLHERSSDQHFRTALMVELLVNSARQKELFYWSLGTGLIGLSSSEKFGIFDASRNQATIHNILNRLGKDMAVRHNNVNDGQPDKWGFYLLAGVGAQKFINFNNPRLSSRQYTQITTRLSTLAKHSELRLEMGADLGYKVSSNGRASVAGAVASTAHSAGTLNEASVFFKYENGEQWEASLGFTCYKGKLANYATYNTPNTITGKPECLYKMGMKYYLD